MEVEEMYRLAERSISTTNPNFDDIIQEAVINTWRYASKTGKRWRWKLRKAVLDAIRKFADDDYVPFADGYSQKWWDQEFLEIPGLSHEDAEFVKMLIEYNFEFETVSKKLEVNRSTVFRRWVDLRMQLRKHEKDL